MLVVFYENFLEIGLSFVVGGSKLTFFVGQILNSRIVFILGRSEYKPYMRQLVAGWSTGPPFFDQRHHTQLYRKRKKVFTPRTKQAGVTNDQ